MGTRIEQQGAAAVVTLDWPETRNALGPDEVVELAAAIREAGTLPSAALIITGNGAFCSGGDLRKISTAIAGLKAAEVTDVVYKRFQSVIAALEDCPLPLISAVDGPAIGLGMDLALACDLRFVGAEGYLHQGWARAGLITGTGGVAFLESIAPGATWRLLSHDQKLAGADAERFGLATAVPNGLEAALEAATALSRIPEATRRAYVKLERPLRWPSSEFLRRCAELQGELLTSPEFAKLTEKVLGRS